MKSLGLYGQEEWRGVYCLTGQFFEDIIVVIDLDCDEKVAARINPVAENPMMGKGRSSGRSVVSIGFETGRWSESTLWNGDVFVD